MKHGEAGFGRTMEYTSWVSMRGRCNDPADPDYRNCGGRGIGYCERWESFENFLADMGRKPSAHHKLERIDINRGYEPGNCKWQHRPIAGRNRRMIKLRIEDARKIRALYQKGSRQLDLATRFSISQAQISKVVRNQNWREAAN